MVNLGRKTETYAERFLRKQGYKICARNYRCAFGEIDLVARENHALVFIEVKGRRSKRYGSPVEAVTFQKRQQIIRVAKQYLAVFQLEEIPIRFDVLGVLWREGGVPEITLVKDAFSATR
jgi:putative endonuclease